jgi:serine/threonine protein kinase
MGQVTIYSLLSSLPDPSPFIVPLFFFCDEPTAIGMKYCSGGSLQDLLSGRNTTSVPALAALRNGDSVSLLRVSIELVSAVAFLHAHGVFHLDMKPQNVLMDEKGTCHLSDFGASYTVDMLKNIHQEGLALKGQFVGTPLCTLGCVLCFYLVISSARTYHASVSFLFHVLAVSLSLCVCVCTCVQCL